MNRLIWIHATGLILVLQTGCTSLPTWPAKMNPFASRSKDTNDPLANLTGEVTPGYKSAKKELKKADRTLLQFARWREDMGDLAEAKQQYQNILTDNPENADARLGIARVEFATGRVAEAVDILMATARLHPDRADVWVELGRMQSEREQWGQAVQSLTKAIELEPSSQSARYQLGLALARSDRLDEARPHLVASVGESASLYNIGYVLYEADRFAEAEHWFRLALDSHPDQRTKALAGQMLAKLSKDDPGMTAVAQQRPPSRVDVAQTSYESYQQVPGQPREQTESASINPAPSNQPPSYSNAGNAASVSPGQYANRQYPSASNAPSQIRQWQGPSTSAPPAYGQGAPGIHQGPVEPQPWRGPTP